MHETAISRRTKLRLEADAAREEQEKLAMELRCREERAEQERALEEANVRHQLALMSLKKQQERAEAAERHAVDMRHEAERLRADLERKRAEHDEELRHAKEQVRRADQW